MSFEELKELFHSDQPSDRKTAILKAINEWDPRFFEYLTRLATSDPSEEVQLAAIQALSAFPISAVLETLNSILESSQNKEVWLTAARVLSQYDSHDALLVLARQTMSHAQDWLEDAFLILSEQAVTYPEIGLRSTDIDRKELINWAINILLNGTKHLRVAASRFISHAGGLYAINSLLDAHPKDEIQRDWLAETLSEIAAQYEIEKIDDLRKRALD